MYWIVLATLALRIPQSSPIRLQQECGGTSSKRNGTITSPSIQSSSIGETLNCDWMIDTKNISSSQHLEFRVISISVKGYMPHCNNGEYLEIFIGCRRISVGRFCGVSVLPVFYSPDGCMNVVLRSQGRSVFRGVYSLRPLNQAIQNIPGGCGVSQHDNARHGNIFSPLWPLPYPEHVDCIWTVTTRKDLRIKLIFFDFDVQAKAPCNKHDFIEVRAGSNGYTYAKTLTRNKECGHREPFSILVGSSTFYITFQSVKTTGPRGFMAGFVAYEKEAEEFNPQVLIILGVIFLSVVALVIKMFVIPALVNLCKKKLTIKDVRQGLVKLFRRRSACSGTRGFSFRRMKSFRKVEDYPVHETDAPPTAPVECFLDGQQRTTVYPFQETSDFIECINAPVCEGEPRATDDSASTCALQSREVVTPSRPRSSKLVRFASNRLSRQTLTKLSSTA